MTRGDWLLLGLLVTATGAALAAGARSGRFGVAALASATLLSTLWALALLGSESGWRDADGWIDCYPSCSLLQDAVGTILFVGGILALLAWLAVLAALVLSAARRRSRL